MTRTAEYGKYTHRHSKANLEPVFLARKYAAGVKCDKLCHRYQAGKIMQPAPKRATGAKHGKTTATAKHGKTCHRRQVRENISPLPSAGKSTDTKRGKT